MKRSLRTLLLCGVVIAVLLYVNKNPIVSSSALPTASFPETSAFATQENGSEITKSNWQQHPKIKAIRAIVQSVDTALTRKSLTIKKRSFEDCEPYEDALRTIATDSRGHVRYYAKEAGSEDSALKWQHYYDEKGNLRFVFITGGAVNGAELEHRIYFDEYGKRIWELQVYTKGPGYTFPEIWPDDQLQIKNPAMKFASKAPCKETHKRPGRRGAH
ncbi:MAG: hypothetical protein QOJ64_4108 [Acidobacteriota bacterium]|jgi:hypothetical protein|nr:hypothetical protein [Acidobacteriota bacterium]